MPKHPEIAPRIAAMQGGVFSRVAHRIAAIEGEKYPLHVGDTWMEPMAGARMEDLSVASHPGMHRYSQPRGLDPLVDALAALRRVERNRIIVTAGATGGLGAVAGATLAPGDEVLVLAPYWPLIPGIVRSTGGTAIDVPFYGHPGTVAERLAPYISPRTTAVYVNTPNNPTGLVLEAEVLAEIAAFARAHNLWIWSDEVYEDYVFAGTHRPMAPHAPERTFTAYSFSKAYGMAGNRCGYVVGPNADVMAQVRKVSVHTFYAAPTASQWSALHVVRHGRPWVDRARGLYQRAGQAAAERLGVPAPQGGTFLFIDVAAHLDERGLEGFLVDCIERRLILAPGSSCGSPYPTHVRVCFTSAPPAVVSRGIEVLAQLIGQ